MKKKIKFKRQTIGSGKPFIATVMAEDPTHYYFYDNNGFYSRIKKIHEGKKYFITSMYGRTI